MTTQAATSRLQWYTFGLSLLTTTIIGTWAFVKFFCVTLPASQSDREFKDARQVVARIEAEDKMTPVLGIVPMVSIKRNLTNHGDNFLLFPTVKVIFENLGHTPIHIDKISVAVQEATANEELQALLLNSTPETVLADTSTSGSSTTMHDGPPNGLIDEREAYTARSGIADLERRTNPGRIMGIEPKNLRWKTIKTLTRNVPLDFELRKSQKRSLSFDYVLEPASKPKWYRFVITASPSAQDDSWNPYQVTLCIPGGDGLPELDSSSYGPAATSEARGGYDSTPLPGASIDLSAPPFPGVRE